MTHDSASLNDLLRALPPAEIQAAIDSLDSADAAAILSDWSMWARPKQLAPPGNWRTWLVLAGRGWGKTRVGAEFIRANVEAGEARRIALVARTSADVRDVIVEGESGIMAISPPWNRPKYEPSKRRLTWPNGAQATCFSADEPDLLRGPQHDLAWCDELASWQYPEAWDMLMFGLRLGQDPRVVVTTTPKPTKQVRELLRDQTTTVTRGTTYENRANLAPPFLAEILKKYEGTRLGRQELHAEILDDAPGALWQRDQIDATRASRQPEGLRRIVVGVDPAVTSGEDSDETGIVVAAAASDGHAYILADLSCRLSPDQWAKRAVAAYHDFKADRIVAEVNNGGDLVERILRTVDHHVSYRAVRASRGKVTRAEPIAALYEQCIAQGQLVETATGPVPIELVRAGDEVWTRAGLRRVLWAGQTGERDTVEISHGSGVLVCTPDHPVHCQRGFIEAARLVPKCDTITTWKTKSLRASAAESASVGSAGDVAPVAQLSAGSRDQPSVHLLSSMVSATIGRAMGIGERLGIMAENYFTALSGGKLTESLHLASMYTISTAILGTMTSPIFVSLSQKHTPSITTSPRSSAQRAHGRNWRNRKWSGGPKCSQGVQFANNAGVSLQPGAPKQSDSARRPVTRAGGIGGVAKGQKLPVYNLHVNGCHEFFVGGVLVHNCRVHHVGMFAALEDQMCLFTPDGEFEKSPDRADALVWALSDLMLKGSNNPVRMLS